MKELSIEEKARAYDKALAIAKEQLNGAKVFDYDNEQVAHDIRTTVYNILPELKESEDERIKKEIVELIMQPTWKTEKEFHRRKELVAWLEKQGEQKPVDKVESIFEVGNWVVANEKKYTFLVKKGAPRYQIEDTDGDIYSFYLLPNGEEEYHLWTIEDAKDGDVLCTYECDEPKIVFILKGTPKKHRALRYHCYYNIMYPYFESDSETGCLAPNEEDVKPATEEQCDILFQKMKEAGYKWDKDKKELIKL